MDSRYNDLADVLTRYSTRLKKGEKVLIDAFNVPDDIVIALVRAARSRGALPQVAIHHPRVQREMLMEVQPAVLELHSRLELERMQGMDAYIALRGADNIFELADVPPENMRAAMKIMRPVQNWRVSKTKWVVLRWPSAGMAQQALSSTQAFEDFYFRVCTMDYSRMVPGMKTLKDLMDKTSRVELKGPGTDLRFSIEGLGSVICGGLRNIPDGEVFSCPVRDSVEGHVTYNVPSVYQGEGFDGVRLEFKKGRVVNATCSGNNDKLNKILDSDDGARYVGEFALGFNPHILSPMRDILFDEKIAGSFHFTPGQAYEGVADNGNRSQVHWDLVNIQRPEYGGGEVWFDGQLIRKDGLFVVSGPDMLNPDFLLSDAPVPACEYDEATGW